jgi:hypothetical protein
MATTGVQELIHENKPAAQVCSKCPWRIDNQRVPLAWASVRE